MNYRTMVCCVVCVFWISGVVCSPLIGQDERGLFRHALVHSSEHWQQLLETLPLADVDTLTLTGDVDNRAMRQINRLPNLQRISLEQTRVSDSGLRHLANLKKLQHLEINVQPWNRIQGWGFSYLTNSASLRSLKLQYDSAAKHRIDLTSLSSFPQLESLEITAQSKLDPDQLASLSKCIGLKHLRLSGYYTDNELAPLVKLQHLESLHVNVAFLSDAILTFIESLPHLKTLEMRPSGSAADSPMWRSDTLPRLRSNSLETLELRHGMNLLCNQEMRLPNLRSLTISGGQPQEYMNHIAKLGRLEKLDIEGSTPIFVKDSEQFTQIIEHTDLGFLSELRQLTELGIGVPISDAALKHISTSCSLKSLSLTCMGLDPDAIRLLENQEQLETLSLGSLNQKFVLPEMPRLREVHLSFAGGNVSGKIFREQRKSNLEAVGLYNCTVDAEGLRMIASFQNLKSFVCTDVLYSLDRENAFESFQQLPQFSAFHAGGNFNDQDLHHVAQIGTLEVLDLVNTSVTDDGLASLEGHPILSQLFVGVLTGNRDELFGLEAFPYLPALVNLETYRCRISNDCLRSFAELPMLDYLRISTSTFDLDELVVAIPRMKVLSVITVPNDKETIERIILVNPQLVVSGRY